MPNAIGNLYDPGAAAGPREQVDSLLQRGSIRIERITSHGEASAPDFWYDQEQDEWVALLKGTASLEFADAPRQQLVAGDYLTIPAHVRHRVARTSDDAVWLAVHFGTAPQGAEADSASR